MAWRMVRRCLEYGLGIVRNFKIKLVVGCSAVVLTLGAGQAFAQETTVVTGSNNAGGTSPASANGSYGTAVGSDAAADGSHGIAMGHSAQASGQYSIQIGGHGAASGNYATVVGNLSSASGDQSTVIGASASASGQNSVALGFGSVADEDNTVSVGSLGAGRRITNLADGVNAGDATSLSQVQQISADALSGANAYADSRVLVAQTGAAAYTDSQTAAVLTDANTYADAKAVTVLADANTHADGVAAQALATSRTYTDTKSAQTLSAANAYTDWKVDNFASEYGYKVDRLSDRLDGVGAMSSAMAMMAGNTAGSAAGLTNRLSMAVGGYRGQAAIAAGYTHNSRAVSVNLGVSATGRDVMSGGSVGFAW